MTKVFYLLEKFCWVSEKENSFSRMFVGRYVQVVSVFQSPEEFVRIGKPLKISNQFDFAKKRKIFTE